MDVALQSSGANCTVIPSITDAAANALNMAAIDRLVVTGKYKHIVAWGKWVGFTPQTVQKTVELAEEEGAPEDSIQKFKGRWLCIADIVNQSNRDRVDDLAREPLKASVDGEKIQG